MDAKGVVHLVYGKEMNAYYAQSRDGGKTFSRPVQLNTRPMTVTVGMERGPKIAIGKENALHVVWQGHYQKGGGVWVTRSLDGGKTFAPERNVLDKTIGIDEPTIAADKNGQVVVLWLDGRLGEDPDNPVASPLFMAWSSDNGASYRPNKRLETDFKGRGCSCCMLWARYVEGELAIAFRTGYHDIRDMYLLRGTPESNNFRAKRVSADNWKFHGCPMSGPRFAVRLEKVKIGPDVTGIHWHTYVAWMSEGKAYWTFSPNWGYQPFAPRIPAPDNGDGNYPMILTDAKARVLYLWTRDGKARWALYSPDSLGSPRPKPFASGVAGDAIDRPSAFVRPDGGFVILL